MTQKLIEPQFAFPYQDNQLTVDGVSVKNLVKKYGSPLYIYSGNAIRESYARLKASLRGLPVQVCYAVKANSNIHILKLLSSLGAGCDLVSYGEWYRAELAKVPRDRRVLSGVGKTVDELEKLFQLPWGGVGSIHVESIMELELLAVMANAKHRSVRIALRYNPDVDAKTLDKISTGRQKDKFGLNEDEILKAVHEYGEDPFLHIEGLSVHIGSQITQIGPYEKAFRQLKKLSEKVEKILDRNLSYVDLGGGIGVQYDNEKTLSLSQYGDLVRKHFPNASRIFIEPGRSLVANAGIFVSEVVFSKERKNQKTLILDSGMNDLIRPALYDAYHEIIPVERKSVQAKTWDVVGGICESTDYFARGRKLKIAGEPGELVAFLSAGAYGFSMSSSYNSRPRVPEILVDQGKAKLIRRREKMSELVNAELVR